MQSAGRPGRQARAIRHRGSSRARRETDPARARETPRFFFYKKDCSGLKVLCCMPVTNMLYSERGMENRIYSDKVAKTILKMPSGFLARYIMCPI